MTICKAGSNGKENSWPIIAIQAVRLLATLRSIRTKHGLNQPGGDESTGRKSLPDRFAAVNNLPVIRSIK